MADQQHTPKPWRVVDPGDGYRVVGHGEQDSGVYGLQEEVCVCYGGDGGEDRAEANARLISAAPDLLAALKEAFRTTRPDGCSALKPQVYEMCRAAIAKATGGKQ